MNTDRHRLKNQSQVSRSGLSHLCSSVFICGQKIIYARALRKVNGFHRLALARQQTLQVMRQLESFETCIPRRFGGGRAFQSPIAVEIIGTCGKRAAETAARLGLGHLTSCKPDVIISGARLFQPSSRKPWQRRGT